MEQQVPLVAGRVEDVVEPEHARLAVRDAEGSEGESLQGAHTEVVRQAPNLSVVQEWVRLEIQQQSYIIGMKLFVISTCWSDKNFASVENISPQNLCTIDCRNRKQKVCIFSHGATCFIQMNLNSFKIDFFYLYQFEYKIPWFHLELHGVLEQNYIHVSSVVLQSPPDLQQPALLEFCLKPLHKS